MNNTKKTRIIAMKCPVCGKNHDVEERMRDAVTIIKGQEIEYKEIYYYCSNASDDENEFEDVSMMNSNLLNARNAYRVRNGLLTSDEIVKLREEYGLSQVDLARLLGWGEATISRYESKAIQDEAYDNTLRLLKKSPYVVLEYFKKNATSFSSDKESELKQRIFEKIDLYGREVLTRQALESEYVIYDEPSTLNGFTLLNIDKLEAIISYYAQNITELYKVKLMKLLWYADALCFQIYGRAMTGLVYQHKAMGALPIGHNKIMSLDRVKVHEESSMNYDLIMHIYPCDGIDYSVISVDENELLNRIVKKFRSMSTKELVDYMHEEQAYKRTTEGDIISFSMASDIRKI